MINGRGHSTTYGYDRASRKILKIDQLDRRTTYTYDQSSNQNVVLDARGNHVVKEYDGYNRLVTETYNDGRVHVYGYDPVGNQTRATGPSPDGIGNGTYVTTYTSRNEVLAVTNPDQQVTSYTYTNVIGRRRTIVAPDVGTTDYFYDGAGRQNGINDPRDKTATMKFDRASRQTEKRLPNGNTTACSYDRAGNKPGVHTKAAFKNASPLIC